jgi:hypothetical protein
MLFVRLRLLAGVVCRGVPCWTHVHHVQEYMRHNPIPLEGNWDSVSGEDFLRNLLTAGVYETKYSGGVTNPLFCSFGSIGIDPRAIGQRIMDIRSALAKVRQCTFLHAVSYLFIVACKFAQHMIVLMCCPTSV